MRKKTKKTMITMKRRRNERKKMKEDETEKRKKRWRRRHERQERWLNNDDKKRRGRNKLVTHILHSFIITMWCTLDLTKCNTIQNYFSCTQHDEILSTSVKSSSRSIISTTETMWDKNTGKQNFDIYQLFSSSLFGNNSHRW